MKTYVLDTNVLLYSAQALESFEDNRVVIPMAVIEELDKFKKHQDELGRNARQVIRRLDELRKKGSLFKGVPLDNGNGKPAGTLQVIAGSGPVVEGMDMSQPDNRILRVVQYLVTPSGSLAGHFDLNGDAAVFYSGSRFSYRTADGVQTASGVDVSAFDDEDATLPVADAIRLDDGTSLLIEESDDNVVESLYDQSLHLIHRKVTRDGELVTQTSWSYDENGHVISMDVVEADVRTIYEYDEDGEVRCQSEYVDGQLREVRMNRDDDTVLATRYRDGVQYARIVYDRDGSRVLSLEMLR